MAGDSELDVCGRPCPIPVIEAAKALARMDRGSVLTLRGTDPAIPADLAAFCASAGHSLLDTSQVGTVIICRIRKGTPFL